MPDNKEGPLIVLYQMIYGYNWKCNQPYTLGVIPTLHLVVYNCR